MFNMQIQRFLQKAVAFVVINSVILLALLLYFSGKNRSIRLDIKETESNLLSIGENQHYDIGILGTSRGRVFSRDDNHLRVEDLLGKRLVNLAKGGGGGLMPAKLHLSHFYSRGNSVDHIFYLVDPWVFYSPINNEKNNFFLRDEPFEISIFWQLIVDRYPLATILSYLQMIAEDDWETLSGYEGAGLTKGTLKEIDREKIDTARTYYKSRYGKNSFQKYSKFVDIINSSAKENNSAITYIILPLLISDFPGIGDVAKKLQAAADANSHVTFVNFSDKMQSPGYYYDHMHFNEKGVTFFTEQVLAPLLGVNLPSPLNSNLPQARNNSALEKTGL